MRRNVQEEERRFETPLKKSKVLTATPEDHESPSKRLKEMPNTPEDIDAMVDGDSGLFDFESLDEISDIEVDDEILTRSEEASGLPARARQEDSEAHRF